MLLNLKNFLFFGRFDIGCKTNSKLVKLQLSGALRWNKWACSLACRISRPHTTRFLLVENFNTVYRNIPGTNGEVIAEIRASCQLSTLDQIAAAILKISKLRAHNGGYFEAFTRH